MPSSYTIPDYPLGMDGGTYAGIDFRTHLNGAVFLATGTAQVTSGVKKGGGGLAVTAPGGMLVTVATGFAVVASSSGSTYGAYAVALTASQTLTIATADPSNPRIDLVCLTVTDNGNATSSAQIQVVTGTPSGTPVAPALPNTPPQSSVALATVAVAAGTGSVTTGNITDARAYTTAAGGIVPIPSLSVYPAGYTGLYGHDLTTGRLVHIPSGGPAQPVLLPFAPVMAVLTSNLTYSGTGDKTILTASVTTNGSTDIRIFASWPGIFVSGGGGSNEAATMKLKIDGTQVAACNVGNINDGTARGGAELTHYTNSLTSDTPSAATHTITFAFSQNTGGSNLTIPGATTSPITLRVEPVNL